LVYPVLKPVALMYATTAVVTQLPAFYLPLAVQFVRQ